MICINTGWVPPEESDYGESFTGVPWSAMRSVVDAAFQFAQEKQHGGIWAECELVEQWLDANQVSEESCETIHPEAWCGGPENPWMFGEVG